MTGPRRSACAAAILVHLLLGASPARAAKEAQVELPSTKDWTEVKSEHFLLYSDTGAAKTRKIAVRLERFRQALEHITRGFELDTAVPTSTFVFRNERAFMPYKLDDDGKPKNIGGYFLPRPFQNYIALDANAGSDPMGIVYHEFFHAVMDTSLGSLPVWLNEGLAEYFSTFRDRDMSAVVEVGHPIEGHLYTIAEHGLIPWNEVFTTTHDSPTYNEGTRQGSFYAQSWLLVHYLTATDERTRALGRYLSLLRDGVEEEAAFTQAFGVGRDQMALAVLKYLDRGSNFVWWDLGEEHREVATTVRELEPAEVLFRLGDLQAHRGRVDDARRHFEAARALGWPVASTAASAGFAAFVNDDLAGAEASFRLAVAGKPETAEPFVLLARLLLDRYQQSQDGAELATEVPPLVAEARGLLATAIDRGGGFLARLELARSYLLYAGDVMPGLEAIARARDERPRASEALYLHACLLARAGRPREARTLVREDIAPRDESAARSADDCISHGTFVAAWDRLRAEDREGAGTLLQAAIESTDDPDERKRLLEILETVEAGGGLGFSEGAAGEGSGQVERLNEAARLSRGGDYARALELLDAVVASCANMDDPVCTSTVERAREMRSVVEHNRVVEAYNQAIELANAGDRAKAVARLRELEAEVSDPEWLGRIRELLVGLGAKAGSGGAKK